MICFRHNWKMYPDYNENSGQLQSIEVRCSKCEKTTGRHPVKGVLSLAELENYRTGLRAIANSLKTINRSMRRTGRG